MESRTKGVQTRKLEMVEEESKQGRAGIEKGCMGWVVRSCRGRSKGEEKKQGVERRELVLVGLGL